MRLQRSSMMVLALCAAGLSAPAMAAVSAQTAHCAATAKEQGLSGSRRAAFLRTCRKGPLAPAKPTAPTGSSQESQAVTKPSGVDRTVRAKQCAAEADRKHLADKDRSAFQLSCLATAGPVSEGETGVVQPHPSKQIKGIGVNNYKPGAPPAKSQPDPAPPAAAQPKS